MNWKGNFKPSRSSQYQEEAAIWQKETQTWLTRAQAISALCYKKFKGSEEHKDIVDLCLSFFQPEMLEEQKETTGEAPEQGKEFFRKKEAV